MSAFATRLRTSRITLSRLLNGKAGISVAMALRLAGALGTSPELWMNMQSQYDLGRASRSSRNIRQARENNKLTKLNGKNKIQ